jgi:methylated-DNA-[protein]-cysteine S-methyltransferase
MTITACAHDTPAGPLTVLVTDDETVIAAGFTDAAELVDRLRPDVAAGHAIEKRADVGSVSRLIVDYLDGQLDALDRIAVDQPGTDLQHEVWSSLRAIPAGDTRTYTQLAAMTSRPRAIRAAGTACGRNLVAPMVPCHRALRTDGSLGGYYYGLDVKRWLLAHEANSA